VLLVLLVRCAGETCVRGARFAGRAHVVSL
jgi:hypothetical protein